jgi:hypothetical protein
VPSILGDDNDCTLPGKRSQAERDRLTEMLSGGKHAARKLKRAQILLSADSGVSDAVIAAGVCVGESRRLSPKVRCFIRLNHYRPEFCERIA